MDTMGWSTPMVVVAAGLAWWPGVAPEPFRAPEIEVEVPPWVEAEDCVREDRLERLPEPTPEGALRQVVACRRHRPGTLHGTLRRFQGIHDGIDHGGEDALDGWVLAVGMRQGSLLEQAVGLTLERHALEQVHGRERDERHAWVAARRAPLTLRGEAIAMDALAEEALRGGQLSTWWIARSDGAQAMAHDGAMRALFAAPADARGAAADALLAHDPVSWSWWATDAGRAGAWRARSGQVIRDLVSLEGSAEARIAELTGSGDDRCHRRGRLEDHVVPHAGHHAARHRR